MSAAYFLKPTSKVNPNGNNPNCHLSELPSARTIEKFFLPSKSDGWQMAISF